MKKLSQIISSISLQETLYLADVTIENIAWQQQQVQGNTLFCLIEEPTTAGWQGEEVLDSLATNEQIQALLVARPYPNIKITQLVSSDPNRSMAEIAKFFFGNPDESMAIVGVTGTNGKTTTTQLINQLLNAAGKAATAMGTLGLFQGSEKIEDLAGKTTPLATTLYDILYRLAEKNHFCLAMELSSHGIKQRRNHGLDIDIAVFTNITQDHLDFHGTMEDYKATKKSLFENLKVDGLAIVNSDDPFSEEILRDLPCKGFTFGFSDKADLYAQDVQSSIAGSNFTIHFQGKELQIQSPLVGLFNVHNLLAAIAVCLNLGIPYEQFPALCNGLRAAIGRMDVIQLNDSRIGIVDYAHTPDALEKVLQSIRGFASGHILTVFGCGGNKDRDKRSLMGEAASHLSDICIITSDNPRQEDPLQIINDIQKGISTKNFYIEADRKQAIDFALEQSQSNDIILIAGKGHETYQILANETIAFDDKQVLLELAAAKGMLD